MKKFKMKFLIRLFVLFAPFLVNAQVASPQPSTIVKLGPSDAEILNSLKGYGLKDMYLDVNYPYDGLVTGYRYDQIALFKDGYRAGFGMDEGILLSTGLAKYDLETRNYTPAVSNNIYSNNYYDYNTKLTHEDPDLMGIFEGAIHDVVIYKFKVTLEDFTTAIRVEFQFGSDEYPNFVGSIYNDAFGFFIRPVSDGAKLPNGESVINMARLPFSNNPISVNTVNGGYNGSSSYTYPSDSDLTQSAHFINNGYNPALDGAGRVYSHEAYEPDNSTVYIEYNGLTKLITYDLKDLTPGGTYEFKIAIADAGDASYDSGVIIKKIHGTTGADLKIEKEIDNESPNHNDLVEFTLTASNLGPYDANGALVNDLLPSGYTYVSHQASGNTAYNPVSGIWDIGFMQAIHQVETLTVKARVNNQGVYKNIAVIKSNEPDPDLSNNMDWVEPDPICLEERIFFDDFGSQDFHTNFGRIETPYVPSNSFSFGANASNSTSEEEYKIGNGYYAVVPPAFIKDGWDQGNLSGYNWTPSVWEPGVMTDLSGDLYGAVLAVNNKGKSSVFYKREASIEADNVYKVSFWTYLLDSSTRFSLNVRDKKTGNIIGKLSSDDYYGATIPAKRWTNVSFHFRSVSGGNCNVEDIYIELNNDLSGREERKIFIDNIEMTKLASDCFIPSDVRDLDCPTKKSLIITNPVLINQAKK